MRYSSPLRSQLLSNVKTTRRDQPHQLRLPTGLRLLKNMLKAGASCTGAYIDKSCFNLATRPLLPALRCYQSGHCEALILRGETPYADSYDGLSRYREVGLSALRH